MMPAEFGLTEVLQFALALVLGLIIGWERELSRKPAGLKTTTFVTIAGTLIMQVSLKLQAAGSTGLIGDPARLGAAALTGIGFLGAGVILQQRDRVQGITTAASIWMMTAVGLAIGAGFYQHSILVVALMIGIFKADDWLDRARERHKPPEGDNPSP